jgi:hypothetical protein
MVNCCSGFSLWGEGSWVGVEVYVYHFFVSAFLSITLHAHFFFRFLSFDMTIGDSADGDNYPTMGGVGTLQL